jgi:zinc transporter ZupT
MDALQIKILFIFIFIIEALGLGLIPVYCKAFQDSPAILGIANAFSGGVFLAIALMHIFPEQVENYSEILEKKGSTDSFPMPFFLGIIGYAFMLCIDKVLFDTHVIFEDEHGHHAHVAAPESTLRQMSI